MPVHLNCLEALLKTYPDAIFIQTHRAPAEFLSSWNHLVDKSRQTLARVDDKQALAREQLEFMSGMLNKSCVFRQANPEIAERWIDFSYSEFVANPLLTIEQIYHRLQKPLAPRTREKMSGWISKQARQRRQEKPNRHEIGDFGLTLEETEKAFAPYLDFMEQQGTAVDSSNRSKQPPELPLRSLPG